ncbi:hypothetical protein LguiB_026579 [Lonicera macranthoides]
MYTKNSNDNSKLFNESSSIDKMEEESPIRLKNEATKLLIRRLTSTTQKQLDAISIVGIAGIGNTSLAKTVYENPSVVYHFRTRIWFTVSHFRDDRKILCHILTCLIRFMPEFYDMSSEELSEQLGKLLMGLWYLIVMDDVRDIRVWNDLRRYFPDNKCGSRIMLTSKFGEVGLKLRFDSCGFRCLLFLIENESWVLLEESLGKKKRKEILFTKGNVWSSRMSGPSVEEKNVVGFDDEAMKLIEWLTRMQKQLEVISIVGTGGHGKTILARKVYNDLYLALRLEYGSLPTLIHNLQNLETLIVKSGRIFTIPQNTWKMVKLRHLYIKSRVPNDIDDPSFAEACTSDGFPPMLENLQNISIVRYSQSCQDVLARSPNLRKLGFHGPLLSGSNVLTFPSLRYLEHLEKLKLSNTMTIFLISGPNSMKFTDSLKRLTLSGTALMWKEMWIIGMLPNLVVLKLGNNACVGRRWDTNDGGFHRLKFLKFQRLDIVQWDASINHFPTLRHLVLHSCEKLEVVPPGLGDISTVEVIEVNWCRDSTANSALFIQKDQEDMGNDFLKILIKPPLNYARKQQPWKLFGSPTSYLLKGSKGSTITVRDVFYGNPLWFLIGDSLLESSETLDHHKLTDNVLPIRLKPYQVDLIAIDFSGELAISVDAPHC